MTNQEKFVAQVDRLVREANALPDASIRRIIDMLEAARKDIVARLASAAAGTFTEAELRRMRDLVDQKLREFSIGATAQVQAGQAKGYELGRLMVDQPFVEIGASHLLGGLSRHTLAIAQNYSADLISGVSSATRRKINGVLQRAVLGGQNITEIIGQIGGALTGKQTAPSIFSGAGARAVTIARTEIPRMLSAGTQARLEQYAERVGGDRIQKQWKHNAQEHPRLNHRMMDGMVVGVNEAFVVPNSGEQLRYPRDPAGSAAETVNCGCSIVPHVDLRDVAALRRAA